MKADSKLVTHTAPAYRGNYTRNRSQQLHSDKATPAAIRKVTIHHCAAVLTVQDLGRLWQRRGRRGSSHYGIHDTAVGQYVPEDCIAWTDGNWDSNCDSVTIEVSNSDGAPRWPVSDASLQTLIRLIADIAIRNKLGVLELGDNLTWHSMFAATQCPGPYIKSRLQYICDEANKLVRAETETDEGAKMYMATEPIRMNFTATGADMVGLLKIMADLQIATTTEADGTVSKIPAVSVGDQPRLLAYAIKTGLGFRPVSPEGARTNARGRHPVVGALGLRAHRHQHHRPGAQDAPAHS